MIYLDYAATNPFTKYPCSKYGKFLNPNANYAYKEQKLLNDCANRVKAAIGAKSGKVVFGGTSSQLIENLLVQLGDDVMIISSVYEHDSVAGFANQMDDIDEIKDVIQNPFFNYQLIVCLMGVNNITGEIMPIEEIGRLCKNHGAFFICDMTAMIGKAPIPANINQWCDCAIWSGHKLGTDGGIGAMWLSDKFNDWLGDFKLHGTPNLAGALAMTQAVEDACDISLLEDKNVQWMDLSDELYSRLLEICGNTKQIGNNEGCWAISAIHLPGFNARALQSYLASKEIYIGLGQASCADEADRRVLCQGYGLGEQEADEVIRISFGEDSSVEDVETLFEEIKNFKELYVK